MSTTKTIYCKMQSRLGAMDRVVAAFTHRGIIPARLTSTYDVANSVVEMVVSFDCEDPRVLDKLIKFLQKQVYVLETRMFSHDAENASPDFANGAAGAADSGAAPKAAAKPRLVHDVQFSERKTVHAHAYPR